MRGLVLGARTGARLLSNDTRQRAPSAPLAPPHPPLDVAPPTPHLYDTSSFMKLVSALPPRSMRRTAAASTRQSNTGTLGGAGGGWVAR